MSAGTRTELVKQGSQSHAGFVDVKTALRGVSHAYACFAALAAGVMLVLGAPERREKIACSVYVGSLVTMLACSSIYHKGSWSPRTRDWLRRLDHSSIFVLIAGTYTPVCMLVLEESVARKLMYMEWGGVVIGLFTNLFWLSAPKALKVGIYIFLGWLVLPYCGQMKAAMGPTGVMLIALGGVTYTLGAIIYARRWPDPWPKTWGYHEIFHACTILASVFHFSAIYLMIHHPGANMRGSGLITGL